MEEGACAADTKGRNGKASRRIGSVRACRRPVTVQRATGAWPLGPALCFDPPPSLFDLTGAFKKKRESTKLPKEKEITETPKATLARKNTKRIPLPCRTIIHLHVIRASDFDFDLMLYIFFLKKGHESNKRGKYKKKKDNNRPRNNSKFEVLFLLLSFCWFPFLFSTLLPVYILCLFCTVEEGELKLFGHQFLVSSITHFSRSVYGTPRFVNNPTRCD